MAKKSAASRAGVEALISKASDAVRRRFKTGYSMSAEQALETPSVFASTGSLALDRICSGSNPGGVPIGPTQGRVVHIAGEFSTGKSLILDHMFKSVQDMGGLCLCSETEGSRDTHFARAIGFDLTKLEIQRPATIEELVDMGLAWHDEIRSVAAGREIPILWGLDSIDSTEAGKSADKGMTESGGWHFGGGRSEALGAGLRKIVNRTARFPTTLVMLNQTRDNVGVMFGPKKRTPGGAAPHFYASLEVMLSPSPLGLTRAPSMMHDIPAATLKRLGLQYAKDTGAVLGRWVHAKVTKTKLAPTLQAGTDFFIDFRRGCSPWAGMLQRLLIEGTVELTPDQRGARHRTVAGEVAEFATTQEWLDWLSKNPKELGKRPEKNPAEKHSAVEATT